MTSLKHADRVQGTPVQLAFEDPIASWLLAKRERPGRHVAERFIADGHLAQRLIVERPRLPGRLTSDGWETRSMEIRGRTAIRRGRCCPPPDGGSAARTATLRRTGNAEQAEAQRMSCGRRVMPR
jgi:hypothetical protein